MNKKELERGLPEEVGIKSEAILRLIDHMEEDFTEAHGIMIYRHGKVVTEGWWAPYSSNLRHSMMSASKTFSGTAIGIALREGILSLDEKVVDLFPEYLPEEVSDNLKKVTIHHLLSMTSGVEYETRLTPTWIKDYLSAPFKDEPGTDDSFLYNNAPATLLAAIIRKKTGLHLKDYLKPRLFDIIGIDADNITWFSALDGTAFAPGGLHCTTEDLLRLMKLYLDGGVWDGVRILDEDYVKAATSKQANTNKKMKYIVCQDRLSDNTFGYGYMMWMGRKEGTYRAEGAFGQFGFVDPSKDIIIAITQSCSESPVSQTTLDYIWEFLDTIEEDHLEKNPEMNQILANRLARLAIPCEKVKSGSFKHDGEIYDLCDEHIHIENLFYDPIKQNPEAKKYHGISSFSLTKVPNQQMVKMKATINDLPYDLEIPLDGSRRINVIDEMYVSLAALSGYFKDEDTFVLNVRWMEQIYAAGFEFHFEGNECTITDHEITGRWNLKGSVKAVLR